MTNRQPCWIPSGRRDVFQLAKKLNREENITVVWITHFMEEAAQAGRLVVMDKGKIAMEGTPRQVFSQVDKVQALGLGSAGNDELACRIGVRRA